MVLNNRKMKNHPPFPDNNNELKLKCLNRWLKSNKININADKTKYILFSYNKNLNFSNIKIGNNKINETSVT